MSSITEVKPFNVPVENMSFSIIFLNLMVFGAFGHDYTPGAEDYLLKFLIPFLNPTRTFDGPKSISSQLTTLSSNRLPTIDQMMYYNYYAASTYYIYDHGDFSCKWCLKVKPDLTDYEGNRNVNLKRWCLLMLRS